jgi:hypothetical protein
LDTPVGRPANDIDRVSAGDCVPIPLIEFLLAKKCLSFSNLFLYLERAGHTQHEMTSYCSMSSIFQFLEEKLQEKLQQQQNGQ